MPRHATLCGVLCSVLIFGCDDDASTNTATSELQGRIFVDRDLNQFTETVFQRKRIVDGPETAMVGDRFADVDHATRAAAPWLFRTGPLVSEHVSIVSTDSGSFETYELERGEELSLAAPNTRPLRRADSVAERAANHPTGSQVLAMRISGFDAWDVPALPDASIVSPEAFEESRTTRASRIQERKTRFEEESRWVRQILADRGATIEFDSFETGWIVADVPNSVVGSLISDQRLASISANSPMTQNFCDTSCVQPGTNTWRLGQGSADHRFDANRFYSKYYNGEQANPSFHGWEDITVAVMEPANETNWEDEARWLLDRDSSTDSSSRVHQRWRCTGTSCAQVTGFSDTDPPSNDHPNLMVGIVAGDLQDNQGENYPMDDQCWIPWSGTHCPEWRQYASGVAPEAGLQLWAGVNATTTMAYTVNNAAVDVGGEFDRPDVIQMATSDNLNVCDMDSSSPYEDAIEVAYSNGILVVNGPENTVIGSPPSPSGTCTLDSPGDLPTVFTVNGLDVRGSACLANYSSCSLQSNGAARGGIDLKIGSSSYSRVMSGIDISAPATVSFVPNGVGYTGETSNASMIGGTSPASAHVSGAAALVKHWLLAEGSTWVNSPGRLHTIMLGMGDRWAGSAQRTSGFDNIHGVGKLKLRPLFAGGVSTVWGRSIKTHSTTTTGTYRYVPWSSPLPADTEIVKCVMQEHEYMASKNDVSDQYLKVVVRNSYLGSCDPNNGYVFLNRYDSSYDLKHQVAITGSDISLPNKCISVELTRAQISTSGLASASIYCYFSGEKDDEPR